MVGYQNEEFTEKRDACKIPKTAKDAKTTGQCQQVKQLGSTAICT